MPLIKCGLPKKNRLMNFFVDFLAVTKKKVYFAVQIENEMSTDTLLLLIK